MEDTSEMDMDHAYDQNVSLLNRNNNGATPAHSGTDEHTSVDGSPMDWTTRILDNSEQPPASMPSTSRVSTHLTYPYPPGYIHPSDRVDDYMFHHIPLAERGIGAIPLERARENTIPIKFSTEPNNENGQSKEQQDALDEKNYKRGPKIAAQHKSPRRHIPPVIPSKRRMEFNENLDERQASARNAQVGPEPTVSFLSKIYNTSGAWITKARDRARAVINPLREMLLPQDDRPADTTFIYTSNSEHNSNKRRIINMPRPMPGSWPSESSTSEHSESVADYSPATSNANFITTNHVKTSPAPVLEALPNIPPGFTSSVAYGSRKIRYIFNKSSTQTTKNNQNVSKYKSNKDNVKSASQTGNTVSISHTSTSSSNPSLQRGHDHTTEGYHHLQPNNLVAAEDSDRIRTAAADPETHVTPTSQPNPIPCKTNLKRARDALEDDDHVMSNKFRRTEHLDRISSTERLIKYHTRPPPQSSQKANIADHDNRNASQTTNHTVFNERRGLKTRMRGARLGRNRIADGADDTSTTDVDQSFVISTSQKTEDLLNNTQPQPSQNITHIHVSTRLQDKAERSSTALFNRGPPHGTYREPEERPSTSSSNTTDDTKETQNKNDDDSSSTEDEEDFTNQTESNDDQAHAESIKDDHSTQDSSDEELNDALDQTRLHMDDGDHVDLRTAYPRRLDELMEHNLPEDIEYRIDELEISDNRNRVRELEELEKQKRTAELERAAEERQKAQEEAVRKMIEEAQEAARRAEEAVKETEEAKKKEKRRQTLDETATPAALNYIQQTLRGRPDQLIREHLLVRDLQSLVPNSTWLNDEVVNTYLGDLVKRELEKKGYTEDDRKKGKAPPIHNMASQFWTTLFQKGPEAVKSWARRPKLTDDRLLQCERVLIPICHHGHWRLVVVSGTEQTIEYFDSLPHSSSQPFTDKILAWVKLVLGSAFDAQQWRILGGQRSPAQCNTDDCGVFVLQNARAVVLGLDFRPNMYRTSTEGVLRTRHQIAAQLLSGGVDWE